MEKFEDINWIVIPGGPGLSASYLKIGLAEKFAAFKIHFYDPLGAPERTIDHVPTIDELVEEIFAVATEKSLERFGLITHSFGNYLAMRAIERNSKRISNVIMISPTPFTAKNWKLALQNIEAKIPGDILEKIKQLSSDRHNGSKIFELLFPYYSANPNANIPHTPFDLEMCDQISAQVGEYDDTQLLLSCGIPWACIVGEQDPFYLEKDLLAEHAIVLPSVGHYPFFESQAEFAEATSNIGNKL